MFTQDRGWVEAGLLAVGDMVRSHDGQWVAVEGSEADDRSVVVYNLTVSKYHSFFVGGPAWGFSVWVHNQNICEELQSLAVLAADPSKKAAFEAQAAKLKKRLEDAKANPSAAASQKDLEDFENIVKLTKKDGAARAAINKAGIDPNTYKAPKYTTRSTNPKFVEGAAETAEKAVIDQKLAGSLEKAQQSAKEGKEIAPGLFKYQETESIEGYAQHHLWPQALGGPKQGWTVYARQPHQTVEGIQGRLNAFLRDKTGKAQRELEVWARENPDKIVPYLREFYKKERIPFPY